MPQTVQVEGVGLVEFPDEFTPDQIRSSALSMMQPAGLLPPYRSVPGEVGARMGRGALQVLKGVSDYGAAAQKFYGPLAKLSPIGYGDYERSSQAIESVTPQPGVRQGFGYDVAEGLGQFAPMLLAGLGAGALAGGGAIGAGAAMGTAAGLGFGMEFSDAYDRELERQQREGLQANPDLAFAKAMGYGTVSSLIEGKFGSGRIAAKIGKALSGDGGRIMLSRGVSPELVRRVAGNALQEAGIGFGQEAVQRFAQDIIVEGRPEWENIGYEGLVGGAVQGITGVPLGALQVRAADRNARLQAALEENKILEQEANDRRNQFAFSQANDARMGVQPNAYVPTEADILGGPSPTSVAASRLAALESRPPETFGPGFRGDIVPRIELTPDVRERLAALRKQDQEAASRGVAVEQAAANLEALQGRFRPGTRAMPYSVPALSPEITEQLWRIRQQEAANASAVRESKGQLPQTGTATQGVQAPSGNVVEQKPPVGPEPVESGEKAQAPKPKRVRTLRSKPQPTGGEINAQVQGKEEEVVVQPSPTGVPQQPAGSITPRSAKAVDIEDVDAVEAHVEAQQSALQSRANQLVQSAAPKPIRIGPSGSSSVIPGDEVETTMIYRTPRRTKFGKQEELVGKVRGRVIRETPSGGVVVEFTAEEPPGKIRPKYTGKRVVVGAAYLTRTGKVYGQQSKNAELPTATPEMLAKFAPSKDSPITDAERKQFFDLGYDYDDLWEMDSSSIRDILATGKRGPGKREFKIGKKKIGESTLTPAQTYWKSNREYFPAALHAISDILQKLQPFVTRKTTKRYVTSYDPKFGLEEFRSKISKRKLKSGTEFSPISAPQAPKVEIVETPINTADEAIAAAGLSEEDQDVVARDMESLARLLGRPAEDQDAAFVFARRFWDSAANPEARLGFDDQIRLIQAMTGGEPTPLQREVQATMADPMASLAARRLEKQYPWEASGYAPWIQAGASPTIEGVVARQLRIGEATRDILGRLGAAVVEEQALDRAMAARADEAGNITLVVNPQRLGQVDPSAQNAAGTEELIHITDLRLMHREWVAAGRKGSFADFVEKQRGDLWRSLDQKVRDQVVAEYSGEQKIDQSDGAWGLEYLRRLVQKARYGTLTEEFVKGAKPKVESIFRRILNFLREIIAGSPYSAREAELIAAVEAVLDGLAINVALSPRGQAVLGGTVAGRGIEAGVSPSLLVQEPSEYRKLGSWKWSDAPGIIFHATSSANPIISGTLTRGLYGFTRPSLTFWRGAEQSLSVSGKPIIYRIIAQPEELDASPDIFVKAGTEIRVEDKSETVNIDGEDVPIVNVYTEGTDKRSHELGKSIQAGVSPAIRSIQDLQDIVTKGGNEQVPERLNRQLEAEKSLFDPEWIKQLETRYAQATLPKDSYTVPPTGWAMRRENMVARALKPIVEKVRVVAGMRDPETLQEDEKGAAYYGIARTHEWLMGVRNALVFKLGSAKQFQEQLNELQVGIDAQKAIGSAKFAAARELVDGYQQHLKNVQKTLPAEHPIQGRIASLLSKAALAAKQDGTNGVFDNGNVADAIQWMAEQPAIVTTATSTPEQIVDQAVKIGGNLGIKPGVDFQPEKIEALYFGVKDDNGKYVVAPALHNIPNLPEIINLVRGLSADLKQTIKETEAFKQLVGLKPSGNNPVALRAFLNNYMRLRDEARENVQQARAFSTKFQKNENNILAISDVLGMLDELMSNPAYFNMARAAIEKTGTYFDAIHYPQGHTGKKVVYDPIDEVDVEIDTGLTKEQEYQNIIKLQRLIDNIDKFLEANASTGSPVGDPLAFVSYKRAKDQLTGMWMDAELAPEWNIVNPRLFGAIWPKFTPGLTKRYMAEFIGGRMGRALNTSITHLDVLLGKIYNIQQDKDIGTNAVQVALSAGINSHQLDPNNPRDVDTYQREVLNWIVYEGQYASQTVAKAGDHLKSGRVATPEDIAAAKKAVAYRNAIRRVSETDSIVNNLHSSIAEDIGVERTVDGRVVSGKRSIHRKTVSEGPLETAASKQVSRKGAWVEKFLASDYATRLEMLDPETAWTWFHDVIIGYLGATDPLFNRGRIDEEDAAWRRGSIYEDRIRKLHSKVASGEVRLTDWQGIADALGESNNVDEVQKNLINEAAGWMEKYKKQEIDTQQDVGDSVPMKALIASLHNDGSFMHPRLKSNAPPTFYTYGDVASADLAGYAANASNIARARVLEEMMRITFALNSYVDAMRGETGKSKRQLELESRKKVEAGEIRFSFAEAERLSKQMSALTEWFGTYARTHAEAFDRGVNQFIRATNSFYAGTLLQSPMAVLNNAIDALYSNPLLMNTYMSNWKRVLLSPLYTTQQIFNVAMGRIMSASKKYPELKAWVKKNNTFVSRTLKSMIEDWESWNKLKSDLESYGINTGLDWTNQRALRKQALGNTFFSLNAWKRAIAERQPGAVLPALGTLEKEKEESSFLLKFGRTIYNSWLPSYLMRYVPRRVDQLANVMIAMQWTKAMGKLMERSITIGKNRANQNPGTDPTKWHLDPKQRIQPAELEMTPAQMNVLRKSLDPIGGLERVMFSYYDKWNKASQSGGDTNAVPWLEPGEMENWLMAIMQAGNVVREGNTIDVAKAYGTPGTLFFTFLSWPANRLLNVVKSFNSMNYAPGGMPTVAAIIALMITAIAAKELKRPIVEAVTGKVSSMPTLGNVMAEANPVEVGRYLASAAGSMIPLIGNTVEVVTGGATGRPLFDATASIPALGLIADTVDTAKKAVDSGDGRVWLDWVNRHGPAYALAVNRLPGVEADLAARNAARAVRAATPADMEVRSLYGKGGGMSRITPFTRHLRSAEAAAYSGNEPAFRESVAAAKQYQIDRGQDAQSAEQSVVSYLRSRMPMSRVYGRAVSPAEYERVTGRMSGSQRRAFEPSVQAYGMAERVTGRKLKAYRETRRKKSRSTLRAARLPKFKTKLPTSRRLRSAMRPSALA